MRGYTLLELIVVIGLISLISESILGIYFTSISSQRRIFKVQEALSQINYVLEYMERQIRMAKKDDIEIGGITKNCLTGNKVNFEFSQNSISFRNYQNQCQKFYFSDSKIYQEIEGNVFPPLTSIKINSLKFNVIGQTQEDKIQPRVTISIEAEIEGKKMNFQTSVSQRDLDIEE